MEKLTTLAQVQAVIAKGETIIVISKENCPNCTVTKANIESIREEAKGVKFFEVQAVQEDNELNRALLPKSRFVFPVIHSFVDGQHVRGTTGMRSVGQLRESFASLPEMKEMFFDITSRNRQIEEMLRKDIEGNVPVTLNTEVPVVTDPSEDTQCDSCQ